MSVRLRLAESRVDQAKKSQQLADKDFQRANALFAKKTIPRGEFDQQQHRHEIAAAEVRSAEFALQVASFEAELASAALLRSKGNPNPATPPDGSNGNGNNNESTTAAANDKPELNESLDQPEPDHALAIVSPIGGRVLRVFQEDAGVIQETTRIVEIGDPRDLEMRIDILSSESIRVDAGDRVIISNWGGQQPLEGTVRLVEPAAFIKTSSLGVEEHRVNVIADFHGLLDCDCRLGDGFRIETQIVVDTAADVITVPAGALFRAKAGWAVYCIENGIARHQNVTIGRSNGLQTEIIQGLDSGDQVILFPTERVVDGVEVVVAEN